MKLADLTTRLSRLGRAIKRAFTYNIGLKLLSIAVAVGLFSMVRGAEEATRSVFVDVVALLPPEGSHMMLISEVPDKVRLTVRGSRSLVNSIRSEEVPPVQVDLREPRTSYYYFDPDEFEIPTGVEIVQLAPASIPLTWAERVEQDMPVLVRLEGSPGPGLAAQAVDVVPQEVTVIGPETEVEALKGVETEPIDASPLGVGRHERRVPLEQPPPHTQYGRVAVRVTLEVVAQEAERTVEGLEVSTIGPAVAQVRPDRVDVTLWGGAATLEEVKPRHLVPTVDASQLEAGAGTQPLPVRVMGVPDGLQVIVEPESVIVTPRTSPPGG